MEITRSIKMIEVHEIEGPLNMLQGEKEKAAQDGFEILSVSKYHKEGSGYVFFMRVEKKTQEKKNPLDDPEQIVYPKIKFNQHNVRSIKTGKKARIYYSTDPDPSTGEERVVIWGKDVLQKLGDVFPPSMVQNNTDIMTDYFEKDRVIIPEGHFYYNQARAAAEKTREAARKRYHRHSAKLGTL